MNKAYADDPDTATVVSLPVKTPKNSRALTVCNGFPYYASCNSLPFREQVSSERYKSPMTESPNLPYLPDSNIFRASSYRRHMLVEYTLVITPMYSPYSYPLISLISNSHPNEKTALLSLAMHNPLSNDHLLSGPSTPIPQYPEGKAIRYQNTGRWRGLLFQPVLAAASTQCKSWSAYPHECIFRPAFSSRPICSHSFQRATSML